MKCLHSFYRSEQGAVLVLVAMLLPVMLGIAGLAVDAGHWFQQQQKLQSATDAGALAGAFVLANGGSESEAESAALIEASNNGYLSQTSNSLTVTFSTSGANTDVKVDISQVADVWFSAYFLTDDSVTIKTTATAEVEGTDGPYCFLALNGSASRAVSISGNVTIDAASCGIANNSNNDAALYLNGNVFVNVGDVKIVGNYQTNGGAYDFNYKSMRTNGSSTADPYASLTPPTNSYKTYTKVNGNNPPALAGSQTACTAAQIAAGPITYSGSGTIHIAPGRYCGGITVTGNNTVVIDTDSSGTPLIIESGDFSVGGGGSITAIDQTIILTNGGGSNYGNFNVTGGKDMYFKAPTTGPYKGIGIYQDRNAPTNGTNNNLNGNAGMTLDGVFYSPKRPLNFGGTSKATNGPNSSTCSKLIADTLVFYGTPNIGNNCNGKQTKAIGTPNVTLIL